MKVIYIFILLLLTSCSHYVSESPRAPEVMLPTRPGDHFYWRNGGWRWDARTREYEWFDGHWERRRHHSVWMRGHWEETPRGYRYIHGHWR